MARRASPAVEAIKAAEAERRAAMGSQGVGSQGAVTSEVRLAVVPPQPLNFSTPDEAVEIVKPRLAEVFVSMVEDRLNLPDALKARGVETMTFFVALDASQELRNWYLAVKRAQAIMDVEGIDGVLKDLDADVSNPLIDNGIRNAKVSAAKAKADHYRWMAQRLVQNMYGEKTQSENHTKVEIVVRREAKKAKAATED